MAVIAAFELNRQIAAGETASDSKRAHRRFCPGIDETNQFHAWHRLPDQFGEDNFAFRRSPKTRADFKHFPQRVDDGLWAMAEQQWSPGADVVDVGVAVDVDQPGTFALGDKPGCTTDPSESPDGRVHASGCYLLGAGKELVRARMIHAAILSARDVGVLDESHSVDFDVERKQA